MTKSSCSAHTNEESSEEVIVLRVQRFRLFLRSCPLILLGAVFGGILIHGIPSCHNIFNYVAGGMLAAMLYSLLPFKNLEIVLSENTLKAPVVSGIWFKSLIIDLSEVIVSNRFVDWFQGDQVTTRDGERIRISYLFYGRKNKQRLVREIELRKARLACDVAG